MQIDLQEIIKNKLLTNYSPIDLKNTVTNMGMTCDEKNICQYQGYIVRETDSFGKTTGGRNIFTIRINYEQGIDSLQVTSKLIASYLLDQK